MVGVLAHTSLLFTLFVAAQVVAAGAIPSSSTTPSQTDLTQSTSSSPPPPTAFYSYVPVTHEVAQQAQTGHNYAIDPFGVLGSTEDSGNNGGASQQAKQTSKETGTTTNGASTEASKTSSASNSAFATSTSTASSEISSISKASSSSSVASPLGSSTNLVSSASTTNSANPGATPSQSNNSANGSSSSGSGMNSWKMIGIGILAFAGIVLLVLGTAFQDSILRALRRPFKSNKGDGDEVLVPDWRRGSWRFGEGEGTGEKFEYREEDGPRVAEGEKGGLGYPLPPVSPFPMRRTPSVNSRHPAEAGVLGNGTNNACARYSTDNDRSILPSPPPAIYAPQPMKSNVDAAMNPFKNPHENTDADAYGGME